MALESQPVSKAGSEVRAIGNPTRPSLPASKTMLHPVTMHAHACAMGPHLVR